MVAGDLKIKMMSLQNPATGDTSGLTGFEKEFQVATHIATGIKFFVAVKSNFGFRQFYIMQLFKKIVIPSEKCSDSSMKSSSLVREETTPLQLLKQGYLKHYIFTHVIGLFTEMHLVLQINHWSSPSFQRQQRQLMCKFLSEQL